ncbi:MAG: AraC family transcriptional regulator [Tannerellaceae bacterium]|nr:AraC family transcriptional regulator [Tannerellaceae bacterium]MCD8264685.1 AraC family transcriptional regulator [Tannerellaceae bacterium]
MASLPTINYAGTFLSCYSDYKHQCVHKMRDHALVYIYAGELLLEEENTKTTFHKEECLFIRRDHRTVMTKQACGDENFKGIFMTFRRNFLREFYNTKLNKKAIPEKAEAADRNIYPIAPRPDLISLFHSLTPYFDASILPTKEIINLKEQEGVYALLNTDKIFYPILFDFTEPWKIDILEFMNENYMYNLTMEEIATFTGRSLATFKRDFAKISDLTPQKWLINKRLQAAYEKLQEEGKKVSDVYVEVGFKNLSHFYSAFKRHYGYSPAK